MVMRYVDDRRDPVCRARPGQIALEEIIERKDMAVLRGVRAGQCQGKAQRQASEQDRRVRPAQQPQIPRRRDYVNVAQGYVEIGEACRQSEPRKLLRLFVAIEAFLFEYQLRHTVAQERHAAIVGFRYDSEDSQNTDTATLG